MHAVRQVIASTASMFEHRSAAALASWALVSPRARWIPLRMSRLWASGGGNLASSDKLAQLINKSPANTLSFLKAAYNPRAPRMANKTVASTSPFWRSACSLHAAPVNPQLLLFQLRQTAALLLPRRSVRLTAAISACSDREPAS